MKKELSPDFYFRGHRSRGKTVLLCPKCRNENPEDAQHCTVCNEVFLRKSAPGRAQAAHKGQDDWLYRFPWRKAAATCAALGLLYFSLPYKMLSAIGIHKGDKAENFAVTGLHGEKMRLSECAGKPVFLYVWETDSQRAIDNLPMINSLYNAYNDKQLCFMPVTVTRDFNCAVRAFAASKSLKYPVYNGSEDISGQFRPEVSPMLYLIDREGYVRKSYSPSINDQAEISSALADLIYKE